MDHLENWEPVHYWKLGDYIGEYVKIPRQSVMERFKETREYRAGVLLSYEGEGGSLLSNGTYVDIWGYVTLDSDPEERVQILGKILVYKGLLKHPEMYPRDLEHGKGQEFSMAELMASHWHARAFLEPEKEEVFMRFAENPSYHTLKGHHWDEF